MPLTPRFSIRQTPSHIYVEISVPSFRLSAGADGGMEVVLMGENNSEFHFYAKPYLLKLNFFPNGFVDQDAGCDATGETGVGAAKYDPSEQTVTVPLLKQRALRDNGDDSDINSNNENQNDNENENDNEDDNHWPDLDLTARMIQPKEIPKKWLHAVVDESSGGANGEGDDDDDDDDDDGNDEIGDVTASIHSNPLIPDINNSSCGDGYGFSNMFRNIFTDYCRSGLSEEMLQLKLDPERSSIDERRDERLEHESKKFDFDRYLADLELSEDSTEDYLYPMVLAYQPWWRKSAPTPTNTTTTKPKSKSNVTATTTVTTVVTEGLDRLAIHGSDDEKGRKNNEPSLSNTSHISSASTPNHATTIFSDDEKLLLSTIPYPLLPTNLLSNNTDNAKQEHRLWCGILELVLAYIYDHLATMGDATVESAWTIFILSPELSWLDSSPSRSVEKTTKTFLRRLLVYPYWRNAEGLGRKVLEGALALIRTHGIHGITKALLQIRAILDKSEVHYLGNKLLVDPYLYWIQNLPQKDTSCSGGLDRIVSELGEIIGDTDKGFRSLVTSVEASLGIDAMMAECFGSDDDDAASSASDLESESSSSDEDESVSESADGDDDSDDDGDNGEENKVAAMVQLLDDEVGHGITDTAANQGSRGRPSMLFCVGEEPLSTATTARPLITEVRSETNDKKSLIQEM
jgi:protein SHQ1